MSSLGSRHVARMALRGVLLASHAASNHGTLSLVDRNRNNAGRIEAARVF